MVVWYTTKRSQINDGRGKCPSEHFSRINGDGVPATDSARDKHDQAVGASSRDAGAKDESASHSEKPCSLARSVCAVSVRSGESPRAAPRSLGAFSSFAFS